MTGQDFRNIINEIRDAMLSGKITMTRRKSVRNRSLTK